MKLYIKTCSNLEIFSMNKQRSLCKRLVHSTLWSQVVFFKKDNITVKVKRVKETFDRLQPIFLDLMILK